MKINSPSQQPFLMVTGFLCWSLSPEPLPFSFLLSPPCTASPLGVMGGLLLLGRLCDNGEVPYPLWADEEADRGYTEWKDLVQPRIRIRHRRRRKEGGREEGEEKGREEEEEEGEKGRRRRVLYL